MKHSILIAGVSGSGKSEVGRNLKSLGYLVYDIDSAPGLCAMVDKDTKESIVYDNDNDLEKIEKMLWLCNLRSLEDMIKNQRPEIAFYCGAPNNVVDMISFFDISILLVASKENIRSRLISRKDNGFGKSTEVQNYILEQKESIEKDMKEKGSLCVDADQDIEKVITDILKIIRKK